MTPPGSPHGRARARGVRGAGPAGAGDELLVEGDQGVAVAGGAGRAVAKQLLPGEVREARAQAGALADVGLVLRDGPCARVGVPDLEGVRPDRPRQPTHAAADVELPLVDLRVAGEDAARREGP